MSVAIIITLAFLAIMLFKVSNIILQFLVSLIITIIYIFIIFKIVIWLIYIKLFKIMYDYLQLDFRKSKKGLL